MSNVKEWEITYHYIKRESSRNSIVYAPDRDFAEDVARHTFYNTFSEECELVSVDVKEKPIKQGTSK